MMTWLLWLTLSHAMADGPRMECFPKGKGKNWPIGAIYLHGLFTTGKADTNGWRKLELNNRKKLEEMAERYGVKIALPIGDENSKKLVSWNSLSAKQIEKRAQEACNGSALAKPRTLIGFSNGGYKARRMARMSCAAQSEYSSIIAIGAPVSPPKKDRRSRKRPRAVSPNPCGKLVTNNKHVFPGETSLVDNALAARSQQRIQLATPQSGSGVR